MEPEATLLPARPDALVARGFWATRAIFADCGRGSECGLMVNKATIAREIGRIVVVGTRLSIHGSIQLA